MPMTGLTAEDQMQKWVALYHGIGIVANHNRGGDVCAFRRSRIRRVSVKWSGFHVTGPRSSSLWASLVPEDWGVRMFGKYDLVNRLSECLCIYTITLSGCMYRRSR